MTNQEIIAYQRRQRALHESTKTIAARLRGAALASPELLAEAADAVDFLVERIDRMNRAANEEARESQRAAGDAYAEGRHDALSERGF